MVETVYKSPEIAREMKRIYGSDAKVVKIALRHKRVVRNYVMKIEEAHQKAADSKLRFPK